MPAVFISYIHHDEIAARALSIFLEAKLPEGSLVFTAGNRLRLGDDWLERIRRALTSAKIVLALFSPESIDRPWVNFEAGGAWFSKNKTLIPVCIGGLKPAHLPKPYSNIQGIDLQDRECIRDFVEELWKILSPGKSPPPFARKDAEVQALYQDLAWWARARRARASLKRMTGKEPG
jgi:hypothetical protein